MSDIQRESLQNLIVCSKETFHIISQLINNAKENKKTIDQKKESQQIYGLVTLQELTVSKQRIFPIAVTNLSQTFLSDLDSLAQRYCMQFSYIQNPNIDEKYLFIRECDLEKFQFSLEQLNQVPVAKHTNTLDNSNLQSWKDQVSKAKDNIQTNSQNHQLISLSHFHER